MNKQHSLLFANVARATYINRCDDKDFCITAKFENKGTDTQGLFGEAFGTAFVVAFRGSEETGTADWITDLKFIQADFPYVPGGLKVHYGFLEAYISVREAVLTGAKDSKLANVICVGHSLGGGLATLAALDITLNVAGKSVSCYTYGSPKVGNSAFAQLYNQKVSQTYRFVNDADIVPSIPPGPYEHVGQLVHLGQSQGLEYSWDALLGALKEKMEDHFPHNYIKVLKEWIT